MYYIKCIVKKTNSSDFIVVENNNIGYKIYTNLKPKKDEEHIMYLSVIHNDDEIIYTGFADEIELETFNVLTSINGIGHKTGLKILKQANYKKLLYLCVNDLHSELLKISHINVENYLSISTKLKKKFKDLKIEIKDKNGPVQDLYKVLRSLGVSEANYEKVAHLENENLSLKDKISKALRIINDR